MHHDVVVIGDGPAGTALAAALHKRGVDVLLVGNDAPWTATYGTWADDVEALSWFDTSKVWADRVDTIAVDVGGHRMLDRAYGVIDNTVLRSTLRSNVRHRNVEVVDVLLDQAGGRRHEVVLVNGEQLSTRVVVDATGWPGWNVRSKTSRRGRVDPPRQTAYGVILTHRPEGRYGEPLLMDFSSPPSAIAEGVNDDLGPSFAYALPVAGGWLVEETVLAARPAVHPDLLAGRLAARLGTTIEDLEATAVSIERVDIPMGGALPDRSSSLLAFGAAASMIHPATGYSLASSLTRADPVAAAIEEELGRPSFDPRRVWEAIWPKSALRSRSLHDYGLAVLLGLDAVDIRSFFGSFFELDHDEWAAYLRITTKPAELARVMGSMFVAAPWRLRRRLVSQNPLALARLLRPR